MASVRAEIETTSTRFKLRRVAVAGMRGTGSYVFDQIVTIFNVRSDDGQPRLAHEQPAVHVERRTDEEPALTGG